MTVQDIFLDEQIRNYATLPILFVVLMVSMLRANAQIMFKDDPKVDMKQMKHNNVLARAKSLKSLNANYLNDKAYRARRAYFIKKDVGVLHSPPPAPNQMQQMQQQDPSAMMGMMKSQFVFIISQGALAYWVSHLFSGFLVAKTPFPLTYKFKSTMQRGVDVDNLEPGYISGLCWYFFIMVSLNGFSSFLQSLKNEKAQVSDPNANDMLMMMGQPPMAGGGMPGMGGGPDMTKLFNGERESLEIHPYEFMLENAEADLLRKWRKK